MNEAQSIYELERSPTDEYGSPLFADVNSTKTAYKRSHLDMSPDIMLNQRPGVHVNDGMGGASSRRKQTGGLPRTLPQVSS